MKDFKKFYCSKEKNVISCTEYPLIENRKLSYLRLFYKNSKDCAMETYVKISVYEKFIKNYKPISDKELKEIFEILRISYSILPKEQRFTLVYKVNLLLQSRGYNIDLLQVIVVDDSIVFLNDSSYETMAYLKSIRE